MALFQYHPAIGTGHKLQFNSIVQFTFGFLIATAYVPGWIGGAISTTYFVLMIGLPILLYNVKIPITRLHLYGTCFLLYCFISLAWTYSFNVAFFIFLQMMVCALAFCYGSSLDDLKLIFKGLALGLGVSAVVAIFQKFGFTLVYVSDTPNKVAGLFVNPNMYSEVSVILLVALLALKQWIWTLVTLPAIVWSYSRAAVATLLVCCLIFMWNKSKAFTALLIPVMALAVAAYYLNGYFDVSSVNERMAIWSDTVRGLTLFGHGVGSYEIMMPFYAHDLDTIKVIPRYAHNDYLQLLFEFGIGCVFLIPFVSLLIEKNNNANYILLAVAVIAMFSFPLHIPMSAFMFFLVAGHVARNYVADGCIGDCRRPILSKCS